MLKIPIVDDIIFVFIVDYDDVESRTNKIGERIETIDEIRKKIVILIIIR